jgi:WD40 repeat protein
MALRFALVLFAGFVCGSSLRAQAPANPRTDSLGDPLPPGVIARLGTLRLKHLTPVFAKAQIGPGGASSSITNTLFSPDGKTIASLASLNLRLWDVTTGKELAGPWSASDLRTDSAAFSFDGTRLAVGTLDQGPGRVDCRIVVWDVARAKLIQTFSVPTVQRLQAIAFADEGKSLVTAGGGIVRWWDIASGEEKRSWKPFNDDQKPFDGGNMIKTFNRCAISPNGTVLAVQVAWRYNLTNPQGFEGELPIEYQDNWGFDLATSKPLWRARVKSANIQTQFAFSTDGKWAAHTVEADTVEIRETATGKLVATPALDPKSTHTERIGALALSADGKTLAIGGLDSHVVLWSSTEPNHIREFSGRITQPSTMSIHCLAFSGDNKSLAAGMDGELQLFDVATLKEVFPWDGHRGFVDYLAFAPDGKRLVTGSATMNGHSSEMVNWDMATWKANSITSIRAPKWSNIGRLSPDYSFYNGKNAEDRVCIYDHATGTKMGRLDLPIDLILSANVFFSPTGRFFIHYGPVGKQAPTYQLFAIPSGKLSCALTPMSDFMGPFGSLAFSPDESLVAFPSSNGVISVCNTATGEVQKRLGRPPEGTPLPGFRSIENSFSLDNKMLASWSILDNVIRVYDLTTGKERLRLPPGEQGRGQAKFAWSPDGRTLAVGDRKIQLFEVATGKLRREFVGHQGAIRSLAFSPNGRLLASGSADTTVLIWDVWGLESNSADVLVCSAPIYRG